jgi:hypothetical protein
MTCITQNPNHQHSSGCCDSQRPSVPHRAPTIWSVDQPKGLSRPCVVSLFNPWQLTPLRRQKLRLRSPVMWTSNNDSPRLVGGGSRNGGGGSFIGWRVCVIMFVPLFANGSGPVCRSGVGHRGFVFRMGFHAVRDCSAWWMGW